MNAAALPFAPDDYWERRAKSAESRLADEIHRCGTAEGALGVTTDRLHAADSRIASLLATIEELRGEIGDLKDAVDDLVTCTTLAEVRARIEALTGDGEEREQEEEFSARKDLGVRGNV